jgi:hypothetical protein
LLDDLADDQPVEQRADGGEVLLDGGRGQRFVRALQQQLDVAGDMDGLDVFERQAAGVAPVEELADGLGVGCAGVLVADVGVSQSSEQKRTLSPLGAPWSDGQDRLVPVRTMSLGSSDPLVLQRNHRATTG